MQSTHFIGFCGDEYAVAESDEVRIRAAAAATGLQVADFIRQAALLRVQEIELHMSLSVLPVEAFDAFKAATKAPGKIVPGLRKAVEVSEGILKDAN